MSKKRHKHKGALHRQHPLQHGRASRLQRTVAHKTKDKQRMRHMQQDRALKRWNTQELSCPHSTWLDAVPEDNTPMHFCEPFETNSWRDNYGGPALPWAEWEATFGQEFEQWMWEEDAGEAEGGDGGDGEASVAAVNPFEEHDGEEGYLSLLGI